MGAPRLSTEMSRPSGDTFLEDPRLFSGPQRSTVHILHVIGSLSPADGGPPEVIRQLARAYPQIGDSLEVVTLDPPDAPFLQGFPCPIHALGPASLGRYCLSPRLVRWLRANANRFDGIVMQGIWTFPGIAVRLAAHRAGKPYCIFPHGALDPWFNKKYPLKHLKKFVYWPIQYPVLRDARAVIFTSAPEPALARKSFSPNDWNAVVFPNGVQDPDGDPASDVETFYRSLPALRDRRFLLFLGRIHEKKGCDLLVQAFARVASLQPDLDVVIAGPDQVGWQAKLERMAAQLGIASRIHWPGMIASQQKWGALRAAEAFILPSHQENFGMSVVESLAAGRPVLISDQVNIWPQIESDHVGLVDNDTLEGTERLLRRWLAMQEVERAAMAARTRATFLRRYSLRESVDIINGIFARAKAEKIAQDSLSVTTVAS
jgi:glycosyltransferase involved in cell wall biosynthesis